MKKKFVLFKLASCPEIAGFESPLKSETASALEIVNFINSELAEMITIICLLCRQGLRIVEEKLMANLSLVPHLVSSRYGIIQRLKRIMFAEKIQRAKNVFCLYCRQHIFMLQMSASANTSRGPWDSHVDLGVEFGQIWGK